MSRRDNIGTRNDALRRASEQFSPFLREALLAQPEDRRSVRR